jgi:hypothetical protein
VSRDKDVRDIAAQLESLLDDLRVNVDALNGILTRPADPGGGESNERLVAP